MRAISLRAVSAVPGWGCGDMTRDRVLDGWAKTVQSPAISAVGMPRASEDVSKVWRHLVGIPAHDNQLFGEWLPTRRTRQWENYGRSVPSVIRLRGGLTGHTGWTATTGELLHQWMASGTAIPSRGEVLSAGDPRT